MPVRHIGSALKKLSDLRQGTKLPGDVDKLLGDALSAVKKLPQMPLRERKEEARKQRDALGDIQILLNDILNQATYTSGDGIPMPDIAAALEVAIGALGDIAEGVGDVAGSMDFNV